MAYEVTATRKRPQQFETLAGQEFVVSTITNAIAQARIAHAYLFSGPRGVGKTTTARLLAKALNCENGPTPHPCGECSNCVEITRGCSTDVIEIDGASNTSVNDIRNIKDEISFPPQHSRYKIYIIDEVHMLSNSAFNALLKTIEEPPEYVIFIFATTETQKVPATIRSRCQQFNFQLLNIETIKKLLKETCDEIDVKAEDEALFWIAKEATGSMRDAYTLFDQVVSFSDGEITFDKIKSKLGLIGLDSLNQIVSHVITNRSDLAITKTMELISKGVSIEQCIKDFADYFHALLLLGKGVTSESILGEIPSAFPKEIRAAFTDEQLETAFSMFLQLYRDIRYSLSPRFELELSISRLGTLRHLSSNTVVLEQLARLKNDIIQGRITPTNPKLKDIPDVLPVATEAPAVKEISESSPSSTASVPSAPVAEVPAISASQAIESQSSITPASSPAPSVADVPPVLSNAELQKLISYTSENDPVLYTLIKQAIKLESKDNVAKLTYGSVFAEKNANANINLLSSLFKKVLSFDGVITFDSSRQEETRQDTKEKSNDEIVNMVESFFGGVRE